jgi:hypothetical protein
MDRNFAAAAPDCPGKTSGWMTFRNAGKYDAPDSQPLSSQPPHVGVGTLDNVRSVFWQSYRHLFPPHALAAQTPSGNVVISWSIMDEPDAKYPYAAPVMLRFDQAVLDTMWKAPPRQRIRIAQNHEPDLREGMRGYDPYASVPKARVVVIG